MFEKCKDLLGFNKPNDIMIKYAPGNLSTWTNTPSSSTRYLKFSTNGGKSWSIPIKFVGDNGQDGSGGETIFSFDTNNGLGYSHSGTGVQPLFSKTINHELIVDGTEMLLEAYVDLPASFSSPDLKRYIFTLVDNTSAAFTLPYFEATIPAPTKLKILTTIKILDKTAGKFYSSTEIFWYQIAAGAISGGVAVVTGAAIPTGGSIPEHLPLFTGADFSDDFTIGLSGVQGNPSAGTPLVKYIQIKIFKI